jgi:hypothetical protein
MILEVGDYFVVTRGEELHPSIMGQLVQFDLPPVFNPTWHGLVFQAMEIQHTLVCARVIGRSGTAPSDLPVGSHQLLDLARLEYQTVSKRFAELLRPPVPEAVGLGLATLPVLPPAGRAYVQVGREQKETT